MSSTNSLLEPGELYQRRGGREGPVRRDGGEAGAHGPAGGADALAGRGAQADVDLEADPDAVLLADGVLA